MNSMKAKLAFATLGLLGGGISGALTGILYTGLGMTLIWG